MDSVLELKETLHNISPSQLSDYLKALKDGGNSLTSFLSVVAECSQKQPRKLSGLEVALERFFTRFKISFVTEVLPKVYEWAIDKEQLLEIPILRATTSSTFSISVPQCRSFLSNMFLGNVREIPQANEYFPRSVSFYPLYKSEDPVGIARVECLLAYLYQEWMERDEETSDHRMIRFKRYFQGIEEFPKWGLSDDKMVDGSSVFVHTDRMEAPDTGAFVDFANCRIHIHKVISSATQEEVLFSCCPEAFLSILLCETMLPNESVFIQNCRRYVDYEGYLSTFQFKNILPQKRVQHIIVMDAEPFAQYKPSFRDLNKCYIGFLPMSEYANPSISSGSWGCGAFGGDDHYSFLEQIIVASYLGFPLYYSSFHNDQRMKEYNNILAALKRKNQPISFLANLIRRYNDGKERFLPYLMRSLNESRMTSPSTLKQELL